MMGLCLPSLSLVPLWHLEGFGVGRRSRRCWGLCIQWCPWGSGGGAISVRYGGDHPGTCWP